jgi:hypothetical protein
MCYWEGVVSVFVLIGIGEGVTVKASVGGIVAVGSAVVGMGSEVFVAVEEAGMVVTLGTGVRVGTFGTQSLWPA